MLYESVRKLTFVEIPAPSLPGILIAILSVIVMPVLSFKKRDLGKRLIAEL